MREVEYWYCQVWSMHLNIIFIISNLEKEALDPKILYILTDNLLSGKSFDDFKEYLSFSDQGVGASNLFGWLTLDISPKESLKSEKRKEFTSCIF